MDGHKEMETTEGRFLFFFGCCEKNSILSSHLAYKNRSKVTTAEYGPRHGPSLKPCQPGRGRADAPEQQPSQKVASLICYNG